MPAEPVICSIEARVPTPEAHSGDSDSEKTAAAIDGDDTLDMKEYSRRRFALQTRKNVVSWELNNVLRDIEDTERYITKLRRELAELDPADDSGAALVHLDYFTTELVDQRQELKDLDTKRRALEVILQDIFDRARALQQRRPIQNENHAVAS